MLFAGSSCHQPEGVILRSFAAGSFFLWAALAAVASARPAIQSLQLNRKTVPKFETLEITAALTARYANPFDPDEIDVSARFVSPNGKSHFVYGFYDQDFTRSLKDGKEALTPAGEPAWKLRFTPDAPGEWKFTATVKDRTGSASRSGAFHVSPSKEKGFIRRSPRSSFYLRYDDGSTYYPVGENVGWANNGRGTYDYEDWYVALGKNGGNWARVWLVYWNMGLEWTPLEGADNVWGVRAGFHGLGRYALDNAWRIDRMLSLAKKNGIAVMLTFGTFGDLKADADYFGAQSWDKNPYNKKNGGPCATPADFFTDPTARKLYKNRLRYLAARYGSDTAVQSWEFFNEMNVPTPWMREMSEYLRKIDPYRHLISHTYGDDEIWKLPNIDFTQSHSYGDGVGMRDSGPAIAALNHDMTDRYSKPHLVAEFGIDWKKPDRAYDPNGLAINLHNGLWSSMMSRGMGGAMTWWWDNYIHPLRLYHEFAPFARFAKRVPWADHEWDFLTGTALLPGAKDEDASDLVIPASFGWGKAPGEAVYAPYDNGQVEGGAVGQFLYSVGKSDLRTTPQFRVNFKRPGRFIVHVLDVMGSNTLRLTLDGKTILEQDLPAGEGEGPWKSSELQKEWNTYRATYDRDFGAEIPAGPHVVQVENAGGDWIQISGYRLTGYRSARYPEIRLLGLKSEKRAVLWIQDEKSDWAEALQGARPALWKGIAIRLQNLPKGRYRVTWWDTRRGVVLREDTTDSTGDRADLSPPPFERDVAADLQRI
jgi:hypothetical protein